MNEQGSLEAVTGLGVLRESAPVAYQDVDGQRVPVDVAYDLTTDAALGVYEYGFRIGAYDPELPLVIDPSIVYPGTLVAQEEAAAPVATRPTPSPSTAPAAPM